MAWPADKMKLDRVRALMKDQNLSALVCRAPDNVLYLTNYWCMKGYDAVVFPRDGEPTLIALEPQQADAERNSWTKDILYFKGYDERDPRPPQFRAWDRVYEVLKATRPDRQGRRRTQHGHAVGRPHGGRADHVHVVLFRIVQEVLRRGRGCDAAPQRSPLDQDRAGNRAHASSQRTRSSGHGLHARAHASRHERERSRRHV